MASESEQLPAASSIPESAGAASDKNPANAATDPISTPKGSVSSIWKWILPAIIVALVAYPAVRYLSSDGAGTSAGDPGSAQAQVARSLQAYQAGQYQEAINAAQAALKIKPDYAAAYNNLAVSYLGLHMYDEAIHNAQEALRVQPDFELAKNNLAWIQREKAQANAPPPAPPKPGTAAYYIDQSLQYYSAGKLQQTIDAAQQALKIDPRNATAYNNIAAGYASLGMWDKAIENAQKALQIQPDFQLAKNNLNWAVNGKAAALAAKKK